MRLGNTAAPCTLVSRQLDVVSEKLQSIYDHYFHSCTDYSIDTAVQLYCPVSHSILIGHCTLIIVIDAYGHNTTEHGVQQGEQRAHQVLLLSSDGTRRPQR